MLMASHRVCHINAIHDEQFYCLDSAIIIAPMKLILLSEGTDSDNNIIDIMSTGLSAKPNEEYLVLSLACAIVSGMSISPQIQSPAMIWLGDSW